MKQINEILEDLTDELKDTLIKSYIEDIYKLKEENSKLIKSYNNLKLNHNNLINLYNQRLKEIHYNKVLINDIREYAINLQRYKYFTKNLNELKDNISSNIINIINGD